MKAAVIWTISDFRAYGMLSGWMTVGRLSCPSCMEQTKSFKLKHGRKHSWFDCHYQFLQHTHVFRKNKSVFYKNKVEHSEPPPRLNEHQVWDRISKIPKTTDHSRKSSVYGVSHNWTKQSIFWELPYWRHLLIRYNLDVMHIEKNVCERILHTIMDVKGKTKDDINARRDLVKHYKGRKLHMQTTEVVGGERMTTPTAPFVLNKEQKKALCEWTQNLKFPDGYASNLSRCINIQGNKLHGMKSHDYHIFIGRLLPIALKELLSTNIWEVLTELSQFFRDPSSAQIHIDDMVRLEKNIPALLCKLEKFFPPSFFNIMEHLPIHLPYQARVSEPVRYTWMYSSER